jgi:molecular chaperone GrpE
MADAPEEEARPDEVPERAEAAKAATGAEPEGDLEFDDETLAAMTADAEVADAASAAETPVEDDIQAVRAQRDEFLDSLRRLQADFDNYRKRMMRQQDDLADRSARLLVEKLLHVLDAADLAIAHGGGEAVTQVAGLLMDTLVKEGLEGIAPEEGEPFDPRVHEAVVHEPGDSAHQEIADVMRAGYLWKGALLRPAMVKVRG